MIKQLSPRELRPVELEALPLIRNRIAHGGSASSVRDLAAALGFSSPRSSADVINRLIARGYLKQRADRTLQVLRMPEETLAD